MINLSSQSFVCGERFHHGGEHLYVGLFLLRCPATRQARYPWISTRSTFTKIVKQNKYSKLHINEPLDVIA